MKKKLCLFLLLMSFVLVKGQEKISINSSYDLQPHPRLLFQEKQEEAVKQLIQTDSLALQLYNRLITEADLLLDAQPQKFSLTNGYIPDMLMISREQVYRMITLSLAYRLTKEEKYLEKAESELLNVCNFPNWNPQHYLDVAEMTTAVAIAYDWLYYDLSQTTKDMVKESLKTKSLDLAVKEYANGGPNSWSRRDTNWNVVCNTGMTLGAMAIAEDDPQLAAEVIQNAVRFTPNCLNHFAPDGVCYEGPSYWGYTNIYLSLLLSALEQNLGHDYGLSSLDGIDKSALYYVHSTSPAGKVFNFGNSGGTGTDANPIYFFFSKRYNQPEVAEFYRSIIADKLTKKKTPRWFFFLNLPWFDDSSENSPNISIYKGVNDIGVLRGKKGQHDDVYLIAKGGAPDMAHQQLDIGTFVVETGGVRWSDDLGADSYDLPGFWDYRPDGQRWKYFRNTNLSHNTLSIDGKIQNSKGRAKIIDYSKNSDNPYFTVDMTSAYPGQAESVIRTFAINDGKDIIIEDKVDLSPSSKEVTWNMITSADISCKGNEAILSKGGKKLKLEIISPKGAVFTSKDAERNSGIENPIEGYKLLQTTIKGKGKKNIDIKIKMEGI